MAHCTSRMLGANAEIRPVGCVARALASAQVGAPIVAGQDLPPSGLEPDEL
jgi:hypothetical protein